LSISQFLFGDGREFSNALSLKQARPLWKMVELSCLYHISSVVSRGKAKSNGFVTLRFALKDFEKAARIWRL